jgi:hypothetical protein
MTDERKQLGAKALNRLMAEVEERGISDGARALAYVLANLTPEEAEVVTAKQVADLFGYHLYRTVGMYSKEPARQPK